MNTLKHVITANELTKENIQTVLGLAKNMKQDANLHAHFLNGKHIAVVFEKPSLRTKFSFTAAIYNLGGNVIESLSHTR